MAYTIIKTSINVPDEEQEIYNMNVKNMNDVLDELKYDNHSEDEILICKSIIVGLENAVADGLRENRIVNIPNIGVIRRNPSQKEIVSRKKELKVARSHMTKEDYVAYVRGIHNEARIRDNEEQRKKKIYNTIRGKNKEQYQYLYDNCGKNYADLWIKSLTFMSVVPFDQEVEDAFNKMNNQNEI